MADNYAIETATRLRDIGFAEFTSDLITKTFEALIKANLDQTESYIALVQEMTKSLSVYINETVDTIDNTEVQGFLAALPPFSNADGTPVLNQAGSGTSPVTLTAGETVNPAGLNALGQQFTSGQLVETIVSAAGATGLTSLVKDALGKVSEMMTGQPQSKLDAVFPIPGNTTYYSPAAFETFCSEASPPVTSFPIDQTAIAKIYDSVAEVIASNKYALLQEMVKLGVLRLVVERGVIRTALSFTTWENENKSASSYDHHKTAVTERHVERNRRAGGIIGMMRNRTMSRDRTKTRDLRVETTRESSSSSQGTNIVITGGVEIYFKTDYLPVAQA